MKLVDKTGALVEVPDDQVEQAYASGEYGFARGSSVPTVAPSGQVGTVRPEDMPAFLAGGGHVAPAADYHAAQLEAKYGSFGGGAAALGEGAARGLSLGLSDPLAIGAARLFGGDAAAEKTRTHLEEEKEAHPYLATGGELAGAIAPVVLSGGGAAPVEGAEAAGTLARLGGAAEEAGIVGKLGSGLRSLGAAPRAVSAVGDAAEHVMGSVLGGAAETTLGRAGQAAARQAVRGIAEGGLFGAGQEISDASLQDRDLTAESLLASVGHGALMGGLLSGAGAGLGSLAKEGVMSALGSAAPKLEDAASEQAWKWLDPPKKLSEEAAARAGGTDAVGRTVFERVLRPLVEEGGLGAAAIDNETKLELVERALDKTGKDIGSLIEGNSSASVSMGEVLSPIDKRIGEFSGLVGGEDKVASLERLRASVQRVLGGATEAPAGAPQLADTFGVEFAPGKLPGLDPKANRVGVADLIRQRRSLQQIAYQESKSLDPKLRVQLLRDVAHEWGGLEQKALNEATENAGELAGDKLRALNKEFQQLKIASDALEHNVARYATNRNLSLTDYMMGAAHAPAALMAGHPLAAIGAVASSVGHKALRAHGNAYAALLLDRLATWGGVGKAAAEVSEATDSAVARFVSGARRAARSLPAAATTRTNEARYDRERDRVQQLAQVSPASTSAHLERHTASLATHAPELAASFGAAAKRATAFLATKLPPAPQGGPLTPQLARGRVTSAPERAKFLRYLDAVEGGPPEILKRLAQHKLTREDAETLRAVYPRTYQTVYAKVAAACADRQHPIAYQQRIQAGILFDAPMDPTLAQPFVAALQASYVTHPNSEAHPSPAPQAKVGAATAARSLFSGGEDRAA